MYLLIYFYLRIVKSLLGTLPFTSKEGLPDGHNLLLLLLLLLDNTLKDNIWHSLLYFYLRFYIEVKCQVFLHLAWPNRSKRNFIFVCILCAVYKITWALFYVEVRLYENTTFRLLRVVPLDEVVGYPAIFYLENFVH